MDSDRSKAKAKSKRKAPHQEQAQAQKRMHTHGGEATLERARAVDVVGLVEARAFEINALQRAVDTAR
ncbi:hypothetical protein LPJ59_006541, partial [Coemansia sp. RSA 2399]